MPSGDAIQSALFVTYLYFLMENEAVLVNNFPHWRLGLAIFHVGVCWGRVYFMCHWFGDTFVATLLGVIIGNFMNYMRENNEIR